MTVAVPGLSAVDSRWLADPQRAVIGEREGLRALADPLPVELRPFTRSFEDRVDHAQRRASGRAAHA